MNIFLKASIIWVCFIPFPILNGLFRQSVLIPLFGEMAGRQISTILLSTAFFIFVFILLRREFIRLRYYQLLLIGIMWLALTLAFEFGFGYFVDHISISQLLADYDITRGKIWPLFLILELITPIVIKYIQRKNRV